MTIKDKKQIIIISLSVVAVGLIIGMFIIWDSLQKSEKQSKELEEYIALEQEEMLNDLHEVQKLYEEAESKVVSIDSLKVKVEKEQLRTQQLLEELQNTRATNTAEITRLKKELKSLRAVLADYTRQIDSLYRENTELRNENTKLIAVKQQVEKEKIELEKEKKVLEEKVDIAAQLDATNIKMVMLRSNGKETKKVRNGKDIMVSCTISRNVTAEACSKVAYVRIIQPDEKVLSKNEHRDIFKFNNRDMVYSMYKEFEYTGEEQELVFYWDIEETLQKGEYHVSIIVDGNIIGEGSADFE